MEKVFRLKSSANNRLNKTTLAATIEIQLHKSNHYLFEDGEPVPASLLVEHGIYCIDTKMEGTGTGQHVEYIVGRMLALYLEANLGEIIQFTLKELASDSNVLRMLQNAEFKNDPAMREKFNNQLEHIRKQFFKTPDDAKEEDKSHDYH